MWSDTQGNNSRSSELTVGSFSYTSQTKSTVNLGFKPKRVIAYCIHTSTAVRSMIVDKTDVLKLSYASDATMYWQTDNSTFGNIIEFTNNGFEFYSSNPAIATGTVGYYAFE